MNNEFSGVIGFWRGPAPRYFVTVPAEQGADLKAISGFVTYGWGVIPVRTRIEREFDPDAIRRLRASTGRDIAVAGPELAGQAMRAGLVDEFHLLVCPVIVGGGTRFFPDGVRLDLNLLEERRSDRGVAALRRAPLIAPHMQDYAPGLNFVA